MKTVGPPFYDPFKGAGQVLYAYPDKVVWYCDLDEDTTITCTQYLSQPILDENQRTINDNAGKRFGDGKVVARIPMPLYFEKLAEARREGDEKYIKKVLNDRDYSRLRTFPGTI